MIRIKQAIVVEGKYDKIKLSSIIDGTIIETNGFRIFRDKETRQLLQMLASSVGLVVLTDSDAAGFVIRRHLKSVIRDGQVIHAYIPDILGKERRKAKPSAEGKLGVEGVDKQSILEALSKAGVFACEEPEKGRPITKQDLYLDHLTGTEGSVERRKKLLAHLNLPERLSTNSMLVLLNTMLDYDSYRQAVDSLD